MLDHDFCCYDLLRFIRRPRDSSSSNCCGETKCPMTMCFGCVMVGDVLEAILHLELVAR